MTLSFAPMDGVTSKVFRSAHFSLFPQVDRYFSPFIAPDAKGSFKASSLRDICPKSGTNVPLVPQVLTNSAQSFLSVARVAAELGYEEINLNLGCPSGTVVAKHKGAGLLSDRDALDALLADIFSRCELTVSVKSRLGFSSTEEIDALMTIYRRYPIRELILHARDREGFYRSRPDWDAFSRALDGAPFPIVYNGNIFDTASYKSLTARFPALGGVMLGRGAAANPALFRMLRGGAPLELGELKAFHAALIDGYLSAGLDGRFTAARMKEHWFYLIALFSDSARLRKELLKARDVKELSACAERIFAQCPFDGAAAFREPV